MVGIFHVGEVDMSHKGISEMEQISRKFPKFPEILGELSMRKQCVLGSPLEKRLIADCSQSFNTTLGAKVKLSNNVLFVNKNCPSLMFSSLAHFQTFSGSSL